MEEERERMEVLHLQGKGISERRKDRLRKPEQKGLERKLREKEREHKERAERYSKGEERAVEKRKERV